MNFFPVKIAATWNQLPENIVSAGTMNTFKNRLDKFWITNPPVLHPTNYVEQIEIIHELLATFQTPGADGWREQQPLNNDKRLVFQLCDCSSNCGRSNPESPGVLAHGHQETAFYDISEAVSIHNTLLTTASTSDRVDGYTGHPDQICNLTHLIPVRRIEEASTSLSCWQAVLQPTTITKLWF
ncbi:hypothetical protein FHG87_023469 [Trinorchestia longiramus]|nr:hypothetical protein FHG87_023469 [Trinorchestia longiramus]